MIAGFPIPGGLITVAALGVLLFAGGGVGLAAVQRGGKDAGALPDSADVVAEHDAGAKVVELDPPNIQTARWGLPQKLWRLYRKARKRRRMADNGYVEWRLIDDTFPSPKYVKPEANGGGIPELEYDGQRYLFPKDAMVANTEQGLWTCIHRRGEADPINIRDPTKLALPADELENYLQMRVQTEPPSWWDNLDLDPAEVFKWLILAFVGFVVIRSFLGGGMPL